MYDEKIEYFKILISSSFAFFYKIFGGSIKVFGGLCILMSVDTIFGWIKSKHKGQWKLQIARWGAAGKIIELIFIGVLYMLDWVFDVDYLKYFGIYYFGICELASILENLAEINKNVPEGLVELIRKTQFSIGTAIVAKFKSVIQSVIDIKEDKK